MGKIKLLNTNNNGYFENNQIDISDSIPTEGDHVVGDIIIKETQVEHMAIGWICIEAGNPGVWSEFGGLDSEFVVSPESVGMDELKNDLKVRFNLLNGLADNIKAVENKVDQIDLSDYATKEELENIDITDTVGLLDELETSEKGTLVGAINELYQIMNENKNEAINAINDLIDKL